MGKIILFILVCFLIYHIIKIVRRDMKQSEEEWVDESPQSVDDIESEFQRKLKEISEEKSKSVRKYETKIKNDKEQLKNAEKIKQKLTNN